MQSHGGLVCQFVQGDGVYEQWVGSNGFDTGTLHLVWDIDQPVHKTWPADWAGIEESSAIRYRIRRSHLRRAKPRGKISIPNELHLKAINTGYMWYFKAGDTMDWYKDIVLCGHSACIVGIARSDNPIKGIYGYIIRNSAWGHIGSLPQLFSSSSRNRSSGYQLPNTSSISSGFSSFNIPSNNSPNNLLNPSRAVLRDFFPKKSAKVSYSDIEIREISLLLKDVDPDWSTVPRLYIVLRLIDRVDLLNEFLSFGFTDHWFPISTGTLPRKYRSTILPEILPAQNAILTKSMELERGEHGVHGNFAEDELLPFTPLKKLGGGGYGEVHEVISTISSKRYARKRIRRKNVFGQGLAATSEGMKQFLEEMNIMKRLSHHHIVQYVGSYTDPKHLVLLMRPVCDMDLSQFLSDFSEDQGYILRPFFGCLAAALRYLHGNKIRHRDIKPQNILIQRQTVFFTDFGLSRDYSKLSGTTSSGFTPKSSRYCAPEVADHDSRNSSSDIWSLGCVFLEMCTVLKGFPTSEIDEFLLENGDGDSSYISRNQNVIAKYVSVLKTYGEDADNTILYCIEKMIRFDRKQRPSADQAFDAIVGPDHLEASARRFCGRCCLDIQDSD